MLSAYVYISLIFYISWKVWVISNRYHRLDVDLSPTLAAESLYALIMFYLLASFSSTFLIIAAIAAFMHFLFGMYVEVFKPEVTTFYDSKDVLANYWRFLVVDTGVTIISYLLMQAGQ